MGKRIFYRCTAIMLAVALAFGTYVPAFATSNIDVLTGSIDAEKYNAEASTATVTTGTNNAADEISMKVEALVGDTLVFDNVDFTDAKCLMMTAAIAEGSTNKAIDLYIDAVAEANKIGTLMTRSTAKVNDLDFNEQYALLREGLSGVHKLVFAFTDATELELDWIKLTSYTGTETESEHDARMQWWRDAKFGQFIHFGAYSYLGGYYQGNKTSGYSEWIMNKMNISKEDYQENAAANFNPTDFDAKKIVSDAKAAGQKYIIITSRHHEGFSIFDTKIRNFKDYSLFSVGNGGNYTGPDPLKALSEECERQGIVFGVYSSIMDWHDPSQTNYGGQIATGYTKEAYKAQLKGQVKELIEKYNAKVFFFDGEWVSWWTQADGEELYRYILSLDEKCIVNNRVGKRNKEDGDYGTPEQEIPATGLDYDWESCVTMNNNWGYCQGDSNWKTPQWIINSLFNVASKGGNLLLNVGPDGKGVVEEAPITNMSEAGEWLEKYGDVIYGASANCYSKTLDSSIRVTTKTEGDTGKVYVSLVNTDPATVGTITLPALENDIVSVKEVASDQEIPYILEGNQIVITVSGTQKQDFATVYEITTRGTPQEKAVEPESEQKNLALNKTATCSSVNSSGTTAAAMVDGKMDTRWEYKGRNDKDPYVQIDLGAVTEIGSMVLYEYYNSKEGVYRCKSFKISASTDGETWNEIYAGDGIGERLEIILQNNVNARYLKLHDFTILAGSNVGIKEFEVYPPQPLVPRVSFTTNVKKFWTGPIALEGIYKNGETVSVQVSGADFTPFTVPTTLNTEQGTWSATIDGSLVKEGNLTFMAYLCDENDRTIATNVYTAEYVGKENLALGANDTTESSFYSETGFPLDYSAACLVDGNMRTRWAPGDRDGNMWAIIDFGENVRIGSIALYEWMDTYYGNVYRSNGFKLSVSENGTDWTQIYEGTEINEKLIAKLEHTATGRYLKIHDVKKRSGAKGNVSLWEVEVFAPETLTGTATIAGEAKYGETLTAALTDTNNTGNLSYQWKRSGADIIGATNETYVLTADDIHKTITVEISSSDQTGILLSDGVTVEKTEHRYGTATYTWSEDGKTCTAEKACTAKGCTEKITEEATVANGKITSAVKTPATCTTKGTTTYTATFGSENGFATQTEDVQDIALAAHSYGTPKYTWNAEHTSCTAEKTCTADGCGNKVTENGTVTSTVKNAATCTTKGTTTYTATFGSENGFTTQTEDVQDIALAAHSYGNDGKCTVCGAKKPSSGSGSYIPPVQKPVIDNNNNAKTELSSDGTKLTIKAEEGYKVVDVIVNGVSKGAVDTLTGLKTGDKVVVVTEKIETEPTIEEVKAELGISSLVARSKAVTMKNGKKAIKITWYDRNGNEVKFDGVEIYRSTKRNTGYGKKPIFVSKTGVYYNTSIKPGTKYYYRVRGYKVIDGQKYYTNWSLKAFRAW